LVISEEATAVESANFLGESAKFVSESPKLFRKKLVL